MPANGDGGSSQFFENPPCLAFSPDDSAVNPSDFGLVLAEEVVKVDNVQCTVLAEEPERPFGRKSSPYCKNYVLSLKRSRWIRRVRFHSETGWIRRVRFHSDLDGTR